MKRLPAPLQKSVIVVGLLAWAATGFYAAQFLLLWLVQLVMIAWESLSLPAVFVDETLLSTLLSGAVYVGSLAIVLYVPYKFFGRGTTRKEMGLEQKWPNIKDIGLAPLVLFATMVLSALALLAMTHVFDGFNLLQEQQLPFDASAQFSYIQLWLIFATLVLFAPVAEELLFRGYLYGKMRRHTSAFMTILLTSLLFAALHLGIGSLAELQWNVFINTFILALGMGLLREYTGSVWAGILVHMLKNVTAYLLLFIAPGLLGGVL